MNVWDKIRDVVSPSISPLESFPYYPRFKVVKQAILVAGFVEVWTDFVLGELLGKCILIMN